MRPAYDQIIQGMSGIMDVTGSAESAPLRVGYPICDTLGGITAALAICAALIEARQSGRGRMIDVSMLEATLSSMGWVVSNFLNGGIVPVPMGNENFTAAPSGTFRTADGLLNIAANEVAQYEKLCDLLGRPDLKTDPRFCDRELRRENRAGINREVEQALSTRGAAEWEALMVAAGVPAGRVLSVPEILDIPTCKNETSSRLSSTPMARRTLRVEDFNSRTTRSGRRVQRQDFLRTPIAGCAS